MGELEQQTRSCFVLLRAMKRQHSSDCQKWCFLAKCPELTTTEALYQIRPQTVCPLGDLPIILPQWNYIWQELAQVHCQRMLVSRIPVEISQGNNRTVYV